MVERARGTDAPRPLVPPAWFEELAAEINRVPAAVFEFMSHLPPPTPEQLADAHERRIREEIALTIAPWLVGKDLS